MDFNQQEDELEVPNYDYQSISVQTTQTSDGLQQQDQQITENGQQKPVINLYFKQLENIPQFFRYFLAGFLGNIILYILDRIVLKANPADFYPETVAWFISNLIQIPIQYILLEQLVYGEKQNKCQGIIGLYCSYLFGICFSSLINFVLINYFNLTNDPAWVISLSMAGFFNYMFVTFLMNKQKPQNQQEQQQQDIDKQQSDLENKKNQSNSKVNPPERDEELNQITLKNEDINQQQLADIQQQFEMEQYFQ